MDVFVLKRGPRLLTGAPYHPEFPSRAAELEGKYLGGPLWTFDLEREELVRTAIVDIFGTDDMLVAPKVTVSVNLTAMVRAESSPSLDSLWLFGRALATRKTPKRSVRLGEDVYLRSGGFPTRSPNPDQPELAWRAETELTVMGVPAGHKHLALLGVTSEPEPTDTQTLLELKSDLENRLDAVHESLGGVVGWKND
jgi:hypothetical protein